MDPGPSGDNDGESVVSEHFSEDEPNRRVVNNSEEEGEGDDLFGEGYMNDYAANPELDRYEDDGVVVMEEVTETLTAAEQIQARHRAEHEMDERDRVEGRGVDSETEATESHRPPIRRRRLEEFQAGDLPEDDDLSGNHLLLDFQNSGWQLKEWIRQERVKHEVDALFRRFVRNFRESPDENPLYETKIHDLITYSKTSLVVDFVHMANFSQVLYKWTLLQPSSMIEVFDKAAFDLVCIRQPNFSLLWSSEVYVRFENIPVEENLRGLSKTALDTLIYVPGVVTRRTSVFPQLKQVVYNCSRCGNTIGPFFVNNDSETKPERCPTCQARAPVTVNTQNTIYGNYQKLTLQERPCDVPPGMVPRQREVILQQDLIDCVRPGDEVVVCGIYTHVYDAGLNKKSGFPLFRTSIEANNVIRKDALNSILELTDTERKEIWQLSKDPRISERIYKSIAPSIHGHEYIKMAIALSLFGGNEKCAGLHRMRGDINVLLIGDPGTGKSQFLKYVQKVSQRSVYNNGKGASAVGLTAAVQKDPVTREWTLEGGALVLADRGICLIDEFDKMNDQDRVSIHEAMEQQSISISKAGIITTLQARCAVIAAANPIGGKYDIRLPFNQNVALEDPIISRFDCICVVRDIVDEDSDSKMAKFLLAVHASSHPDVVRYNDEVERAFEESRDREVNMDVDKPKVAEIQDPDLIPQDLLRKYILYAKSCAAANLQGQKTFGETNDPMEQRIVEVYNELRQASSTFGGVCITVRHLESIIRLSEAHSKMHLRDRVIQADVDVAVRMMVETFISTQKFSVQRGLRRKLAKYLNQGRSREKIMLDAIMDMIRGTAANQKLKEQGPSQTTISLDDVEHKSRQIGIDLQQFLASTVFIGSGLHLNQEARTIVKDPIY